MCCAYVKQGFYIRTLEAVIDKMSNFHEIAPTFTYSQKS